MIAKTIFGLEEILSQELQRLGAKKVEIHNRAVSFSGDLGFMYKANLC
ncbi:MAG: THUMP domain-containing protein, partial [Bacteroidota bacterium]|nr:THUMP domain-containing protein [Bacteroidota bacterium]